MNITQPNKNSAAYQDFLQQVNNKVTAAMGWLAIRKIEYVWNHWVGEHLYRLYIPDKDLLLDFEWYPVSNFNYNYIRVNYDTDIVRLLERIFPETVFDTRDLDIIALKQRAANAFFKENGVSPLYGDNILRLAWCKDGIPYQCIAIQKNEIIANTTKRNCAVGHGTFMMLRYLNEAWGWDEIYVKECLDNSYSNLVYQLRGTLIKKTPKRRVWWNKDGAKWHIKKEQTDQFIPFYLCESVLYRYPGNIL